MKLSTRTRYGMRAILELAQRAGNAPIQLKIIAANQNISVKYLEQLVAMLRSAGLVRSIRGSKGGYLLAKPPDQIKLGDVFRCLEGPASTAECLSDENYCDRVADCATRRVWAKVQKAVDNVLDSLTVRDMIEDARSRDALDYQI